MLSRRYLPKDHSMQMAEECKDRPVGQGVAHLRTSEEVVVAVQEYNSTCCFLGKSCSKASV